MKKSHTNLAFRPAFLLFCLLSLSSTHALSGNVQSEESAAYATPSHDSKTKAALGSLRTLFPEFEGFIVFGNLGGSLETVPSSDALYRSIHIWLPSSQELPRARMLARQGGLTAEDGTSYFESNVLDGWPAYGFEQSGKFFRVQFTSTAITRWLIWMRGANEFTDIESEQFKFYSEEVLLHLLAVEENREIDPPVASDFGLPEATDLYAPMPEYVIEGYDNYKSFLKEHAALITNFAENILAFIPSESLLDELKSNLTKELFSNKERAAIQYEMKKFIKRGGSLLQLNRLTRDAFDTLSSGEYFFAVNRYGTIRFGRELPRKEVMRIESESGRKLPRANHAFLFPGRSVLTAGAFFIDEVDGSPQLREVNAQSGHYFYSNLSESVRDDISEHSNEYFLTLGHFFNALDSLQIPYDRVIISKF